MNVTGKAGHVGRQGCEESGKEGRGKRGEKRREEEKKKREKGEEKRERGGKRREERKEKREKKKTVVFMITARKGRIYMYSGRRGEGHWRRREREGAIRLNLQGNSGSRK